MRSGAALRTTARVAGGRRDLWGKINMAALAFALLLVAPTAPDIRIEATAGNRYTASVTTFDSGEMTTIVNRIKVAAEKRCGSQSVRFGRHNFDSRVDTARNLMVIEKFQQVFFCFNPATDPYKPVPADWVASTAETSNATVYATRFLDRLDRGDKAGIAMMDPIIEITDAQWTSLHNDVVRNRTGTNGALTPKFVRWINNPDWAAYPGAYVYFSVWDDHPGIAGTCGGILLQRVRENEYRISQYDVQYIAQALVDQQGLTDEQLDGLCAR